MTLSTFDDSNTNDNSTYEDTKNKSPKTSVIR